MEVAEFYRTLLRYQKQIQLVYCVCYLRFIADQQVIFHRLWDVVNGKCQCFSFRYAGEPNTSPGRGPICRQRPRHHRYSLDTVITQ